MVKRNDGYELKNKEIVMKFVNPKWLDENFNKFVEANLQGTTHSVNTNFNGAISSLCLRLANFNIPYSVINLGGGVKRITNNIDTCPKCKGCGKINIS